MRKLVVSLLMSLDGVVGAPERLLPLWNEESKHYATAELAEFDALLFGRVTYQMFAARWSAVRGDPFADALVPLAKLVASRSLRDAAWSPSTVLRGDVAGQVAALKQRPGKHILKYGIGELDRTLLEHRLIDELRISLVPVVIGGGRHLFDGISPLPGFGLANTKTFANGIIRLTYGATY